jgi:uncharacterized protein
MKPSRYNHFFTLESGVSLAFNSATGALAEIEEQHLPRIRFLLERPDGTETEEDKQFLDALVEGGYLVPDGIDEVAVLRSRGIKHRLEGVALVLTIAPTLACNFSCDYCFENQSNIRMDEATEQALLAFSDRQMNHVGQVRLCWFGGEPTLCLPTIERLQNAFQQLAAKHQIDFVPASIITNGYLLDGAMAHRLAGMGIQLAQVTLDGPEEIHDQRRKLHSGKGTFRRIVDNLAQAADILTIGVRINVDRDNIDSAYEVIEILDRKGILPKVNVHFAQVNSTGAACVNIRDRCFAAEEFSQRQVQLYRRLFDRGIYHVDYPQVFGGVYCGAVTERSYVVSPTGRLFKCWEQLSMELTHSVGDIFSPETTDAQKQTIAAFKSWDPFQMTECRVCDILPICLGGCPVHGKEINPGVKGICSPWRYNLGEMLELRYLCEAHKEVNK